MNEPDETGWSHIHHCAYRGYIKSLERFVENDPDSLELQTHTEGHLRDRQTDRQRQ